MQNQGTGKSVPRTREVTIEETDAKLLTFKEQKLKLSSHLGKESGKSSYSMREKESELSGSRADQEKAERSGQNNY